ncbi:MAG: S-layer homology domain-containing protein [Caldiserica bacterium]|nr:S-layer homology domain-containing protein [Caldisericota bacterium]MDH7562694.1 S-layer homology domain-containing protein [Caldisericota bacterium]
MKITRKVIGLGLVLALVLSMGIFPVSQVKPALANGVGNFVVFNVTPTNVAPGDQVTFNFSFLPSVYVPTGYIVVETVPSGALSNPIPNPPFFTNVPTGNACTGSIKYTVTATSGSITAYGIFYIVTETDTYWVNSNTVNFSVGKTLTIGKSTTATTVVSGSLFTYNFVVSNNSGSTATQIRVTDILPSDLAYVGLSGTASLVSTSPLIIGIPDLPDTGTSTFLLTVSAKTVTSTKTVINIATVTASGFLTSAPAAANAVTIIPATKAFTKEVNKTQAAPGDTLTYTIKFTNPTGSPTIFNAKIIDNIPPFTQYLSASTNLGTVTPPTTGQNYVTWNLDPIPPNFTVTAILNVQALTPSTVISNIAYFYEGATQTFSAQAPNVTVLPAPFTIEKTVSPTVILPGQLATFTISFKYNSTETITGVTVTDYLDSRFTPYGVGGTYPFSFSGNNIIWSIGTLAPGTPTITLSFTATANLYITPGTSIPNTASVKGTGTAEVSKTIYVLVGLPSALTLQKTVSANNVLPGEDALFTITVQNPTTNPTIPTLTITDTLPPEVTFKGATSGYTRTDSVVSWTISNIAPGATGTVTIEATVIPTVTVGATVTNTAKLEVGGLEPVFASASFQVGQAPVSPLKVSKIATADSVKGGEYITYIIIYANTGNAMLPGAKIEDYAPANTTFLNGNPSPVVGPEPGKLTWILGDLPPGANGTIIAQFSVASTVPDGTVIENRAKGIVSGYQDSLSPTVFVKVGQVQHNAFIQGYPDGTFRPEKPITRAEIAAILTRIMGLNPQTAANPNFADVQSTHWAFGYISAVVEAGIMQGYPDHTFHPDQSITRAELATVMVRARGLFPLIVAPPTFPDIAGHWAAGYIEAAQRAMFITGYPSGDFRPDQSITRAETVTLIDRSYGRGPLTGPNVSQSFPDVPTAHWAFSWIAEAAQTHFGVHSVEGKEILINYLP